MVTSRLQSAGAGRSLSVDALLASFTEERPRGRPPPRAEREPKFRGVTWAVVLLRFQIAVMYAHRHGRH